MQSGRSLVLQLSILCIIIIIIIICISSQHITSLMLSTSAAICHVAVDINQTSTFESATQQASKSGD